MHLFAARLGNANPCLSWTSRWDLPADSAAKPVLCSCVSTRMHPTSIVIALLVIRLLLRAPKFITDAHLGRTRAGCSIGSM